MSNSFFRFKQFTVFHDQCAMKVGTDGVLLGAWTDINNTESLLDVGTGSGLIALMLAQKNNLSKIHAIDIDKDAIKQAKENISNSPYSSRITCERISLEEYVKESESKFDLIVSNPPFFDNSLKSPNRQRTLARHTDSLPVNDLICQSSLLLSDNGRLSIIYPYEYKKDITLLAKKNNLHISRITNVYPTPKSEPKRILIELSRKQSDVKEENIIIEKERHIYSDEFTALAKDFYLKL